MAGSLIQFRDDRLVLDPSGAVFWPARRMLVAADLHLEKSSAAALQGALLPPYDTRATIEKLQRLTMLYAPAIIVLLGDSFHDNGAHHRLAASDHAALLALSRKHHFVWITGNHDPALAALPGEIVAQWQAGHFVFRHAASAAAGAVEISGHFHPKANIQTNVRRISRPCFIRDETRMILPAFGAYTGGLDVQDPAIARFFPGGAELFLTGTNRLFGFSMPPCG